MHDCISSNPLCFFDFRGLFLHFLLEYPPNFSPKFFGYTPKLFGYPILKKEKVELTFPLELYLKNLNQ